MNNNFINIKKMISPTVVTLKRRKGKVVQDCDVYIGRRINRGGWDLPQSKWANPFRITRYVSREESLKKYREYVLSKKELLDALPELSGKRLGCWCNGMPCHGDVLVELFNKFCLSQPIE